MNDRVPMLDLDYIQVTSVLVHVWIVEQAHSDLTSALDQIVTRRVTFTEPFHNESF